MNRRHILEIIIGLGLVTALSTTTADADALTALETWAPPGAAGEFKTASACHYSDFDYYGVFAVFTVPSGLRTEDQLWYLLVDGLSSSGEYGEIVTVRRLVTESVISHVDCTTDGRKTAWVVWDRSDDALDTDTAHWARVHILGGLTGPWEVPPCEGRAAWANSIAYHDGAIAVAGAGRGACSACSYVWPDATDHETFNQVHIWIDGQVPGATDIIWNGYDSFLHATLLRFDGSGDPAVVMTQIGPDGDYVDHDILGEPSWTTSSYEAVYLVLSENHFNPNANVLVQTYNRTFWTDRWGHIIGDPLAVGPFASFPTSEYWGRGKRIAQTWITTLYGTAHGEWPPVPGPAENVYTVAHKYLAPVAAASSTDASDPEVILIRRGIAPKRPTNTLYLHLESQE